MENITNKTEIMEMYRRNPQKGFEMIYNEYSGPIFRCLKGAFSFSCEEAEDLLQNIFLPWVKNPEKLAQVEKLRPYLYTSARNAALKFKKAAQEHSCVAEAIVKSHDVEVETNILITSALSELPENQKEAVVLKIWSNMTFEDIAELQKCNLQTVASRYRYAITKLKGLIPWQK